MSKGELRIRNYKLRITNYFRAVGFIRPTVRAGKPVRAGEPVRRHECHRSECRGNAAFTLVELVLVVAIIGVVTTIAVPRYAQFQARQRVEAAARRMVADLSYAQRRARYLSKSVAIKFNTASNMYTLLNTPDPDRPSKTYSVSLGAEPYQATLFSVDFRGGSDLEFNGYGLPDTGGSAVVQVGSYQKSIVVDAVTGTASIP